MSSTYVVGKAAAACVDEKGTVFFLLSEQSYESNVHPRTPRWCTTFFGTYEACIARMIRSAGAIEGGSLRGDARTPSAWIKHWREHLANPVRLEKGLVEGEFGPGLYKLPEAHRDAVNALLASYGFPAAEGPKLTIDMNADGALRLLADLTDGRFEGFYAWRFFSNAVYRSIPFPEIGTPIPAPAKVSLDVQVYTLPGASTCGTEQEHVIVGRDGARLTGWEYSTVGSFVSNEVIELEMATPGSAEPALREFRKVLKSKTVLPASTRVTLVRPPEEERYHRGKFDELCTALGLPALGNVDVKLGDLNDSQLYGLRHLGNEYVRFHVDQAANSQNETEQLDLA
ncbi:hypothetical protein [Methylibium petroleiphilum]|uniref:Uncharacterized protein n=1 Tax=Methylibium petroleiphilum (strain ATCC BAA-1232 / LMG 22953 / PM1) TaxID=420662 RepID=A2SNF1_METPP|nr:hypothetical protein [Methylibium petroleiphilum]ABM97090.1 hypothetical protein Mpe_B0315 [Methylibium petroleiphilum PM1]